MGKRQDLIGKRFGRLTVMSKAGKTNSNNILWKCSCDCGNTYTQTTAILNYGSVKSCGCLRNEKLVERSTRHGYSKRGDVHPLYSIRIAMLNRCHNEKDKYYKDYGGRGISVCDSWRNNPEKFVEWAKNKGWRKGLTIDRKDNNKGYSPRNCRFVAQSEQNINTRKTVFLDYAGKNLPLTTWAKMYGIKKETLYGRIKNGWPIGKAIITPILTKKRGMTDND